MKRALALFLIAATLSFPASAQNENAQMSERMDKLERDLMLMQRQMARGEPLPAGTSGDVGPSPDASLEVRLSAMEEQLRALRGQTEQNDFQIKKLSESLDKMQKDTDFRFGELAAAKPAAATPADKPKSEAPPAKPDGQAGERKPLPGTPPAPGQTTAGNGVLKLPEPNKNGDFSSPREHYNYAFRLLNQTQYPEAAAAFDSFTKKYPKDPLVGNAYYWEGETYYIRRDYVNAADYFRQGFEALPEGPKAADNLLKLSMSLDALGRDKEACVVLSQIVTKFKKNSTSVTDRADQEQKRIGCK